MGNFKERIKGIALFGLFVGGQAVSALVIGAYFMLSAGITSEAEIEALVWAYLPIFELVMVLIIAYRYRVQIKSTWDYICSNKLKYFKKVCIYFMIFIVVIKFTELIDNVFFAEYLEVLGENEEAINAGLASNSSLLVILSGTIFTPILEEYVFRYGIMNKVLIGMNRYLSAIITSAFFIFLHIGFKQLFGLEFGEFFHIFLMYAPSVMLSLVYARENNLLIPILFHMYNNTLATFLILT